VDRLFDKHIDNRELRALVPDETPWPTDAGAISMEAFAAAACHVLDCTECRHKLEQYRALVRAQSRLGMYANATATAACEKDVDWYEVAAGLWPEMKARQLITHAALCGHCGRLLRAATLLQADATPEEEQFLAQLAPPQRPVVAVSPARDKRAFASRGLFLQWAGAALFAILFVAAFVVRNPRAPLSGEALAEFAATTHQQRTQGKLALDVRTHSQQQLNSWLQVNLPFPVLLPASPEVPGERRPYRLEGARLVKVRGKPAVYISYLAENDPVSLLVAADSSASPSGGVVVDYKKVSFHYRMVAGYKVVTWSLKGRTYALVSHESNTTQRSCMVCHSAMGDRDLTNTPTPLAERIAKPAFQ